MPLGALVARKSLMTWEPGSHGSTFGGNPVSCAAALATLNLIENGFMQNAAMMGDTLLSALKKMQETHPLLGDVRGKGLMIGIEMVTDRSSAVSAHDLRDAVVNHAFENGLLLLGAGESVLRLMPALNVDPASVEEALDILETSITAVENEFMH
jgi:4-aminobutyrate aminotransferase